MADVEELATTNVNADAELLAEEVVDGKKGEEPEKVEELEEKPEEKDEVGEDEEKSGEEEKVEPEPEEKAQDLPPHSRPTIQELKTKYPTIFKDFPSLRDMYFREKEFSNIFPSLEDAKEAAENNDAFQTIREGVLSGEVSGLFEAIRMADEKALGKMSSNLLTTLHKISPDDHWTAVTPLLENVVRAFFNEGKNRDDENLSNAAIHLSQFLFSDQGAVAKGEKTFQKPKGDPEELKEIKSERSRLESERSLAFTNDLTSEASKSLRDIILERGQHNKLKMDPEGQLSVFVRDAITEQVMSEVGKQMESDKTHIALMNSLWSKAKKSGYVGDWKARIVSAYLARAKSLVPAIRNRLVSEALGTAVKINEEKGKKVVEMSGRKEPGQGGKPPGSTPKTYDPKKVDWSKTSDDDFLNDKVTLRS